MDWSTIVALKQPPADATVAYGPGPSQYGELRLPKTAGPYPVVVLLHGGCWSAEYGLDHVRSLAGAITGLGYATWTVEYRRLGEAGGGWPGTLLDVGHAVDYVRTLAKSYPLDLTKVVVAGHSAGGQLALWAAGRPALAAGSELAQPEPLAVHAVVGLAAISDVAAYSRGQGSCNAAAVRLLGGSVEEQGQRYRDALPAIGPQIGVYLVHGDSDPIVPVALSQRFVVQRHGKSTATVVLSEVPGAGHFDVIAYTAPAWAAVVQALQAAVK